MVYIKKVLIILLLSLCILLLIYCRGRVYEAVKLSDEIGVKKSAEQLGIPYYTLAEGRQKRSKYGAQSIVGSGKERTDSQRKRELELEKENAELRKANEILKEALGFFAKDQKR